MDNIQIVNNLVKAFVSGTSNETQIMAEWHKFIPDQEPSSLFMDNLETSSGQWKMGCSLYWVVIPPLSALVDTSVPESQKPKLVISSHVRLTRDTSNAAILNITTEVKGSTHNAQSVLNYFHEHEKYQILNQEETNGMSLY